ncbi:MAG: hypothetical protein SGJ09_05185 [Phycisphaerae bacterium]|nr:hypothetical protein [Phycisphaerae bacterium]
MRTLPWILLFAFLSCSFACYDPWCGRREPLAAAAGVGKPTAVSAVPRVRFPARIAIARLQGEAVNRSHARVVVVRSAVDDEVVESLRRLSLVRDVVPIGAQLIPSQLASIDEVRDAAASVQADVVLIYTVGAIGTLDRLDLGPINVLTLGMLPTKSAAVDLTASATLLDVVTGFSLATAETSESTSQLGNDWTKDHAARDALDRAERRALTKLFREFERAAWPEVIAEFR